MEKKIKTWHWYVLIFIVLSALVLKFWQYRWPDAVVELNGQTLHVLVAETMWQQQRGLGGRDSLGNFDGMIFPHDFYEKIGIVMRDMRFPIDIVWFSNGKVVDMAKNVPLDNAPEDQLRVYRPRLESNLVLELPANLADKLGMKIGDIIVIK